MDMAMHLQILCDPW